AKRYGKKPREAAEAIARALPATSEIARTSIAGPGFINFTLSGDTRVPSVTETPAWAQRYGRSDAAGGRRFMVEFVSANPTGPLHVGHGRQAALGDAIASLLESRGGSVTREFYYNGA